MNTNSYLKVRWKNAVGVLTLNWTCIRSRMVWHKEEVPMHCVRQKTLESNYSFFRPGSQCWVSRSLFSFSQIILMMKGTILVLCCCGNSMKKKNQEHNQNLTINVCIWHYFQVNNRDLESSKSQRYSN